MFSIFKNIFTVVCFAITLMLILELFYVFVEEMPTTTANLEEQLSTNDLPDVVVCMDPGFGSETSRKYGYKGYGYFMGQTDYWGGKFVGWNGDENQTKSSREILEEILLLPKSQDLLFGAGYAESLSEYENANVTFMMLIYPIGRCMVIRPPPQETLGNLRNKYFFVDFNNTYFNQLNLSSVKLNVFLMDNKNSPKLNPDDMEMVGDQMETKLENISSTYRVRISRSEHVSGDPHVDCAVYTQEYSYDDCIRNNLKGIFQRKIGCQPPHFADKKDDICDQKFNVSDKEDREINEMFEHLFYKDLKTGCKIPCTKSKYSIRLNKIVPYPYTEIYIVFDETLDVARSRFSINANTFLTKLGGLIGFGRTLLWILVSLLGTAQVKLSDTTWL